MFPIRIQNDFDHYSAVSWPNIRYIFTMMFFFFLNLHIIHVFTLYVHIKTYTYKQTGCEIYYSVCVFIYEWSWFFFFFCQRVRGRRWCLMGQINRDWHHTLSQRSIWINGTSVSQSVWFNLSSLIHIQPLSLRAPQIRIYGCWGGGRRRRRRRRAKRSNWYWFTTEPESDWLHKSSTGIMSSSSRDE